MVGTRKTTLTLAELETLARERSQKNWHQLLRSVSELFLADVERYATLYGEEFSELVCRLLDEVAVEARAELSNRIAPLPAFPDKIVLRLAHDDIVVASPVLENSPVLQEADLVEIVERMLGEHTLAISRRSKLGTRLTETIVRRGTPEVVQAVARNPGARFSETGYRMVVERAKTDPLLQEALVERSDITQAAAIQLNPFLSDELRKRLRFPAQEPEGGSLLDSLSELALNGGAQISAELDVRDAKAALAEIRAGTRTLNDVVEEMAEANRTRVLTNVLAHISGLPENAVKSSLLKSNGMPIAITCRAVDLSRDAFWAVVEMRGRELGQGPQEKTELLDKFKNLTRAEAEKTLNLIKTRKAS